MIRQDHQLTGCHTLQQEIKARTNSNKRSNHKEDAINLNIKLPDPLQRCMELCLEKGDSNWLTALPIDSHGYAVHKSTFRDALAFTL